MCLNNHQFCKWLINEQLLSLQLDKEKLELLKEIID